MEKKGKKENKKSGMEIYMYGEREKERWRQGRERLV